MVVQRDVQPHGGGAGELCSEAGAPDERRDPSPVVVELPARPQSVATARAMAAELGARLRLDARRVGDLRTVVSEACMNAAIHAYEPGSTGGGFELRVVPSADSLEIVVSDHGAGIRPRPASEVPGARMGLLLIAALSHSVEISRRPDGGTRMRISFPRKRFL